MRPMWIAALLALALLPGCADDGEAEPPVADEGAAGSGSAGATIGPGAAAPAQPGSITTSDYEGQWGLGWTAGGDSNTAVGTAWPEHTARGNVTGVVVEMSWTATTPTAEELSLRVIHGESDTRAEGTSPVRLVFAGGDAAGDYRMAAVGAGDPGAYVQQEVAFHVTVFTDLPFDPAFSALAG